MLAPEGHVLPAAHGWNTEHYWTVAIQWRASLITFPKKKRMKLHWIESRSTNYVNTAGQWTNCASKHPIPTYPSTYPSSPFTDPQLPSTEVRSSGHQPSCFCFSQPCSWYTQEFQRMTSLLTKSADWPPRVELAAECQGWWETGAKVLYLSRADYSKWHGG